ncbi:MAG: L,D-transpeptidase family protein, partial [Methylococcales bacterium]|nr:L,D-transpeptidase family protein [Methylococcales bacterium]
MKKLPIKLNLLTTAVLLTLSYNSYAVTFPLPPENNGLIGNPANRKIVKALKTETLLDIARQYDLGQNQIVWANKGVDRWLPSKEVEFKKLDKEGNNIISKGKGKDIFIPSSYLLPKIKREGIVLNLPEYRLYYYHNGKVTTHPISIGRQNWNTPLGRTRIVKKTKNPTWTPPASIRREHAAQGEILPAVWPAGPNNPLGLYKMSLGRAGYLIHSTNKPLGVGMRVSHGCIRMYPEDIERIFPSIKEGTVVQILNNPIKVGWSNNGLYISVHPDLDDNQRDNQTRLAEAMSLIQEATVGESINIQGSLLKKALTENNGIPVALYKGKRTLIPLLINDELGSQIAPSPAKTLEPTSKKSQIKPKLIQATPSLVGTLPPPPPSVGIKTSLQPKKTTPPPSKKAPKIVAPIAKKEVVKKATTVVNKKAKKEVVKKIAPKTIKKTVKASKKPYVPTPVTPPRLKAIQPKANASRNGYTKSRNSTVKSAKPTRSALPPPPRLTPP